MEKKKPKTYRVAMVSMLSAISTILFFIGGVPIFIAFPYLKIDLSDVPALAGSLIISPSAGLLVELIKTMIHLLKTHTLGIGELMSLIIGCAMVASFSLMFRWFEKKNKRGSFMAAFVVCVLVTSASALLVNSVVFPLFLSVISSQRVTTNIMVSYLGAVLVVNIVKVLLCVSILAVIMRFFKIRNFGENSFGR